MKKILISLLMIFATLFAVSSSFAQPVTITDPTPTTINPFPSNQPSTTIQPSAPRYAACDLCGYCPPNPAPQSWSACQKCLYPNVSSDPTANASLLIDPDTNLPPTPVIGHQYTFLGCLGGSGNGFTQQGAIGSVVQSLLNIVFSLAGGIAFLYLLYGSFVLTTSQADPEKLNYGKRVVYGAIIGLIFTLGSVFIVKFIASGVLKIPGFGTNTP